MLLRSLLLLMRLLLLQLLLLLLFLQRELVCMLRAGEARNGCNGVDERGHAVVLQRMRLCLRLSLHLALLLLVLRLQQMLLTLLLQTLVVKTSSLLQL